MGTRTQRIEDRNLAIYKALEGGSEVNTLARDYRLSERTIRGIRREYAARSSANGDGKTKPAFGEIGLTGLKRSSGYLFEEFLSELGSSAKRYKVFNEMRQNSPVASALLLAIELSIRRVEWHTEGEEGDERVDFIDGARQDMAHSWNDHVSEALTMLPFGFAAFEVVYKRRQGQGNETPSAFSDGKIGWHKLAFRSQDSLAYWEFNEVGEVTEFVQQAWPSFKLQPIPLEKMVLYRTTTEKGNPEGRSLLRSAYVPYYYVKNLQAVEAIGAERDLAGLPKIRMPQNADTSEGSTDQQRAEQIVRRVRNDELAGVVEPFGWEFSLLGSPGAKQFDIGTIIERYNKQIALSVLAQFLLLGMDKVGSYSLSKDHSDFFLMAVSAFVDSIAETFNKSAILPLLKLNGMDTTKPPRLVHGALNSPDMTQIGDFIMKVAGPGFIQPDDEIEKWLRKQANMPELTDEVIAERKAREAKSSKPEPTAGKPSDGASMPDGIDEMLKTMGLRAQMQAFSAGGNDIRARIRNIPDDRTRKTILAASKGLADLNRELMRRSLTSLKSITDEEWQRAVEVDAQKERANGNS